MHPFSEAVVFWWDAACLESTRKGGVETGLLSITHNLYPLLNMHQPEEWLYLAMLSCSMVHDVLLIFLLPLGSFPFVTGLFCVWSLNIGVT